MKCPICKPKSGRPKDYDLQELAEHFLDRHPAEALTMGKEMIKKVGIGDTEVVWVKSPKDEPDEEDE